MREHPILFSGPMVRAILEGRKAQTRRVVCPQPNVVHALHPDATITTNLLFRHRDRIRCPYATGQSGDRLWVRETWLPDPPIDGSWPGDVEWNGCGRPIDGVPVAYRKPEHCLYAASWDGSSLRWRPSIHMPRWASRITLEVTEVRVQRLQDITLEDARAEGIPQTAGEAEALGLFNMFSEHGSDWDNRTSVENFARVWDHINGKRAPWESNPWVWAISFQGLP